jgi:predicted Rossmann-fold nucleotide-binding protein
MRTLPASRQIELLSLMQEIVTGWQTLPPDLPPVVAFCGSTHVADGDPLHRAARETARLLAEAGCAIMVGGERGIMQAATRGAGEGGMLSIGCLLAPEQAEASEGARAPSEAEDREGADVRLRFRHELARQAVMQASARAFVVFPGGLETLGELGQALAARRAGVCPRFPLVLYDRASWSDLLQWLWMDERREAEAALDGRESVSDPRFRFFFGDTPAAVVGCLLASLFPDLRQSPDATAGSMSGEKRN